MTTNDERVDVRILVIEPNPSLREVLLAATTGRGWPTKVAGTATAGLAIAAWYRPTIVIVDIFETGMTPSSFATLLRFGSSEELLIVGTATASNGVPMQAAPGFDAVLVKPFEVGELLSAIDRAVGKGRAS